MVVVAEHRFLYQNTGSVFVSFLRNLRFSFLEPSLRKGSSTKDWRKNSWLCTAWMKENHELGTTVVDARRCSCQLNCLCEPSTQFLFPEYSPSCRNSALSHDIAATLMASPPTPPGPPQCVHRKTHLSGSRDAGPEEAPSIMVAPYPLADERLANPQAETDMTAVKAAIHAGRSLRSSYSIPPSVSDEKRSRSVRRANAPRGLRLRRSQD